MMGTKLNAQARVMMSWSSSGTFRTCTRSHSRPGATPGSAKEAAEDSDSDASGTQAGVSGLGPPATFNLKLTRKAGDYTRADPKTAY